MTGDLEHRETPAKQPEYAHEQLVLRAQTGDATAFSELVEIYRQTSLAWAIQLTGDRHLAEDVLQDAWLRAYLHISSLTHPNYFWQWLRRIVHNQAMMALRRGGPYRREYPMSGLSPREAEAGSAVQRENAPVEMATPFQQTFAEPSSYLLLSEEEAFVEEAMMKHLKPRDLAVLRAHTGGTPLQEISEQFNLSHENVYQIISRSRTKLRKRLLESALMDYVDARHQRDGRPAMRVDSILYAGEFWSSAGLALSWALQYTEKSSLTIAEVMGLGGFAFQLCVERQSIDGSGSFSYPWGRFFTQGLYNIGFQARYVGGFGSSNPLPETLVDAIRLVHETLDRGVPAVIWQATCPFFGVATSYEDESGTVSILGFEGERRIPFQELGKGAHPSLFVLSVGKLIQVSRVHALRRTLSTALAHSQTKPAEGDKYAVGLGAYDAWMKALCNRRVNPEGNAYTAALVAEARMYGAEFLQQVADGWLPHHPRKQQIERLCSVAASHYAAAAEYLQRLRRLFPYPHFGDPSDDAAVECSIQLLRQAQMEERLGLDVLVRVLNVL